VNICILTFTSSTDNYGQLLQGYALGYQLRKMGHQVSYISYAPGLDRPVNVPPDAPKQVQTKLDKLKRYLCHPSEFLNARLSLRAHRWNWANTRHFDQFRKKYFNYCNHDPKPQISELRAQAPEADVYICGSDQIWALPRNEHNKAWFLDFGEAQTKRIAYAASYGPVLLNEENKSYYAPLLARFDALGMRERSGLTNCSIAGRNDAELVLDPTLLLAQKDYISLCDKVIDLKKQVFCYFVNACSQSEVDFKKMIRWQKREGMTLHLVCSAGYNDSVKYFPHHMLHADRIEEWIYQLACSKYVYTNSFHGMVFAIVFKKPFLVVPVRENAGMNDRIVTVLGSLGLESRIYDHKMPIDQQMSHVIDWDSVADKLNDLQMSSINFINRNLN